MLLSSKPVYNKEKEISMQESRTIKSITIEPIIKQEEFLKTPQLSKQEINAAIQEVLHQIDTNMEAFKERFPAPSTINHEYPLIDNIEWTDGFWTGMLWLAYEVTQDDKYRVLAEKNVDSFHHRIVNQIAVDHHDLGFLYSLSCVSAWKLTGNEKAKEAALLAADKLITRFQEKGEFIQAWGEFGKPEHYRFIIDCMLNLPLLYWASEMTQDDKYTDIALRHFHTACRYVIREDASAYHTFYMNPATGEPVKGVTHQGYSDDSSWARGQAWGIYGIPLNYRVHRQPQWIPLYKGMTHYFLNRLPVDNVCYWDLIFTKDAKHSRDSSAAAIACCGMLEMIKYLPETDEHRAVYQKAAHNILRSLINSYTSVDHQPGNPLLYHGVYSWHSGKGVDEGNLWGDYYYFEALVRMIKDWRLYW